MRFDSQCVCLSATVCARMLMFWVEGILRGLVIYISMSHLIVSIDKCEHQFTSFLLQYCVMMRLVIYFHSQHWINEGASERLSAQLHPLRDLPF